LTLIVILGAPWVSSFYGMAEMTALLYILAGVFIITAAGNQYRILCQKELQFKRMAIAEISAAFASFIVSVVLAILNYGVYSLVGGVLVQATLSTLFFLYFGLKYHHCPRLIYRHSDVKNYLSFGLFQMGEKSVNYFNSQFDILLIGKILGAEATGIYFIAKTIAMRLFQIIAMIITKVTVPMMAKIQNEPEMLKDIYRKTIHYISLSVFPLFVVLSILAAPIIDLAFGEQWQAAIPVLQILCFLFLIRATDNPLGSLLIAKGRADLGFYWNLGLFLLLPPAIWIGSTAGTIGIALTLLVLQIALKYPGWVFIIKPLCGLGLKPYLRAMLQPFLMTMIAALAALAFTFIPNPFYQIAGVLGFGGCIYILLLWRTNPDFVRMVLNELRIVKS
jgi:O-antigen/teichoic acid export membrane protein